MKKQFLFVSTIAFILVMALGACAQAAETPTPEDNEVAVDVEALINERCSECHPASRAFDARLSASAWSDTIDEMIIKGAEVSEEEKALMIDWFVAQN